MSLPSVKKHALGALLLLVGAPAAAQEELPLMDMSASYTDVIDAFDGEDPIDVNVRAGFTRSSRSGTIQREQTSTTAGNSSVGFVDVAEHRRVTNSLGLGLDVGIYRDLALFFEVPVVLRESRDLSLPEGRDAAAVMTDLDEPVRDAAGNVTPSDQARQLFTVPFSAPARSGIPAVHLGVAWGVTNQHRSRNVPTWVLMLETRLATGSILKACSKDAVGGCRSPGVTDGTSSVRLESRTSYRYRFLEPYLGFAVEFPWVSTGEELFGSNLDGLVLKNPPRTGEVTVGGAVIPWEDRERFQRVAVDLRLSAAYLTEGREVTPLFDALGSSQNLYLSAPNYDRLAENATEVSMTGVSDTTARARIRFHANAVIQAAKYIRFVLGFGLGYETAYMLTGTDACNPAVRTSSGDPSRGGCASGTLNPAHRPAIDVAGNRFRLNGEVAFDLNASATAQF